MASDPNEIEWDYSECSGGANFDDTEDEDDRSLADDSEYDWDSHESDGEDDGANSI